MTASDFLLLSRFHYSTYFSQSHYTITQNSVSNVPITYAIFVFLRPILSVKNFSIIYYTIFLSYRNSF